MRKLSQLYSEIPEQQLLDMLSEDESNFEEGAYALLVGEAKRRNLDERLNEIAKTKEERAKEEKEKEKGYPDYKFMNVYKTPSSAKIAIIKSLLDSENIPYFIKGEHFGTLYGPADGMSAMEVMVREDYAQGAIELLKDFIAPPK
jgi:hypothetical protein